MEYVIDSDGRNRPATLVRCDECGVDFLKDNRYLDSKKHFHSFECATKFRSNTKTVCCASCGEQIVRSVSDISKSKTGKFFCDVQCKLKEQRIGGKLSPVHYGSANKNTLCLHCGGLLGEKSKQYCSTECMNQYRYDAYILAWKSGLVNGNYKDGYTINAYVRKYIHEKYQSKCCKCGWCAVHPISGKIPLTINHINGNPADTTENNLELICPNCHSLTSNYGILNYGNGRKGRHNKIDNNGSSISAGSSNF